MKNNHALLAGILAATGLAAAADDAPGLDSQWHRMAKTADYQTFHGMSATVRVNPYVETTWNKIDFAQTQPGGYQTIILLVRVDRESHRTAVERAVKYSTAKAIVSDMTTPDAQLKWIDANGIPPMAPNELALFGVGRMDFEAACEKGE